MRAAVPADGPIVPPVSDSEADAELAWQRRFVWVLIGVVLLRIVYAGFFPLDLAPDESYYWDWGRRLDIGYFSKPPMIGWLMGLAGWLGGDGAYAIKLFPVMLASVAVVFVYLLGRDMFGARAGFWGAMALVATPANAALNTFFTIDAPLLMFWSASLWFAWRWWAAEAGRKVGWAAALTVSLGFGYLTKQIQLVFPVIWLVFLGVTHRRERQACWGQVGLVVGLSLLFLLPPLIWNWQHDWITFRHTADELESAPFRWRRSAKFVGEFLGGQAGLGGGILWVLMLGAGIGGLVRWKDSDVRERFLLCFFLPGWLAYAGLSVHQRVEQNWPLVFYAAATVLVAGRVWGRGVAVASWRKFYAWGVGLGAGLALLLMAVPFVLPTTSRAGTKGDPTARVRGWKDLASEVDRVRQGLPRPAQTFFLAPRDRYVASALAFYLPERPRTYCWEDPGRPESQYGIWGWPMEKEGWDGLILESDPRAPRVEHLSRQFVRWEPRGEILIRLGPGETRVRRYFVYFGADFRPGRAGSRAGVAGDGAGYPLEIQAGTNKRIDRNMRVFRLVSAGSRIAHLGTQL